MRIPSGVTDQYIYFVAVDATDFTTRETGLATWTVYVSRNGGAAAEDATPTINETDATNMPGVYEYLVTEDMTISAGNDSEEVAVHITHAGMAPVTRTFELYRPKITAGNTLGVAADGDVSGNVDGAVASVTGAVGSVTGAVGSVTAGVTLAAGAVTNASLAGNMEIVFETDFATNYNATRNAWVTNVQDFVGTSGADPFNGQVVAASVTGAVGSVTGSVGSISGVTFPTNFGDLAITITTGQVTVGTNNDKTGYALTQTFPTNFADLSITATTGLVTLAGVTHTGAVIPTVTTLTGHTPQTGDSFARIGAAGASLTAVPWNASWDAEVESECTDAINALFNFTVAGQVDSNAQYWNDVVISTALQTAADIRTEMDTNSTAFATLTGGIVEGATTGTPTTTSTNTDLTGFADDELIGRVIVFTSGTADGQAATITDYASTNGVVSFAALTTAPAAADNFKIV